MFGTGRAGLHRGKISGMQGVTVNFNTLPISAICRRASLIGTMKGTDHLLSVKQINKIMRTEKTGMLGNYRVGSDSFCLETEELHSCCGGVGKEQVSCR